MGTMYIVGHYAGGTEEEPNGPRVRHTRSSRLKPRLTTRPHAHSHTHARADTHAHMYAHGHSHARAQAHAHARAHLRSR